MSPLVRRPTQLKRLSQLDQSVMQVVVTHQTKLPKLLHVSYPKQFKVMPLQTQLKRRFQVPRLVTAAVWRVLQTRSRQPLLKLRDTKLLDVSVKPPPTKRQPRALLLLRYPVKPLKKPLFSTHIKKVVLWPLTTRRRRVARPHRLRDRLFRLIPKTVQVVRYGKHHIRTRSQEALRRGRYVARPMAEG